MSFAGRTKKTFPDGYYLSVCGIRCNKLHYATAVRHTMTIKLKLDHIMKTIVITDNKKFDKRSLIGVYVKVFNPL